MDAKFPFTSYDFWAYLTAGFLLLFAIDAAWGKDLLMRKEWTIAQGVIAVALAYIIGHLAAGLSSLVLHRLLVARFLGYPREIVLGKRNEGLWFNPPRVLRWLLSGYFKPLPKKTRDAITAKAQAAGMDASSDDFFELAYAYARGMPAVLGRMERFLNLYGFCRNIALVALLDAVILYWSYLQPAGHAEHLWWARGAFVVSIGMTSRYLKFWRNFSLEVLIAYTYAPPEETK